MENYERCKDCPYYYGEINLCMFGEEDVPDDLETNCELSRKENEYDKKRYSKH